MKLLLWRVTLVQTKTDGCMLCARGAQDLNVLEARGIIHKTKNGPTDRKVLGSPKNKTHGHCLPSWVCVRLSGVISHHKTERGDRLSVEGVGITPSLLIARQ